jgi:hypothetical protein
LRPFAKSLIISGNRVLRIFWALFIRLNLNKIVLNIPVLAFKSYPFALQKLSFDLAKAILSHSKSLPFAKPGVKTGDFDPRFCPFHL